MKIGMVAPSAHHIGRTKSASTPSVVNKSQKIFRSKLRVYTQVLGQLLDRRCQNSVTTET